MHSGADGASDDAKVTGSDKDASSATAIALATTETRESAGWLLRALPALHPRLKQAVDAALREGGAMDAEAAEQRRLQERQAADSRRRAAQERAMRQFAARQSAFLGRMSTGGGSAASGAGSSSSDAAVGLEGLPKLGSSARRASTDADQAGFEGGMGVGGQQPHVARGGVWAAAVAQGAALVQRRAQVELNHAEERLEQIDGSLEAAGIPVHGALIADLQGLGPGCLLHERGMWQAAADDCRRRIEQAKEAQRGCAALLPLDMSEGMEDQEDQEAHLLKCVLTHERRPADTLFVPMLLASASHMALVDASRGSYLPCTTGELEGDGGRGPGGARSAALAARCSDPLLAMLLWSKGDTDHDSEVATGQSNGAPDAMGWLPRWAEAMLRRAIVRETGAVMAASEVTADR